MAEEKYDFRRLRPRSARSAASQSFYSQRHISVEQLEGGAAASEVVSIEAASHSPPSLYSSEEKQESGSGKGVAGILGNGMVIMGDGQRTSAAIAAQTPERSEPPRQTSSSSTSESRIKARERKRPIAKKSGGVTKPKKKKKNKKIIPRRSSSTSIIDMPPSRTSTRRSFPLRNKASVVAIKIFAMDAATYFSHIPIHELTPEARVTLWRTFLVTPMGEMRVSDFMATFGTLSEEEKRGLNEKIEEVVGEIYGCVERGVSDAGKVWEEVRRVYSWEE